MKKTFLSRKFFFLNKEKHAPYKEIRGALLSSLSLLLNIKVFFATQITFYSKVKKEKIPLKEVNRFYGALERQTTP